MTDPQRLKLRQYVRCTRCLTTETVPADLSIADGIAWSDAWLRLGCPHSTTPPADGKPS